MKIYFHRLESDIMDEIYLTRQASFFVSNSKMSSDDVHVFHVGTIGGYFYLRPQCKWMLL